MSPAQEGAAGPPSSAAPTRPLRVGVLGFFLESNRWAPVTTGAMFAASCDLAGPDLQVELARVVPRTLPDTAGFVSEIESFSETNWADGRAEGFGDFIDTSMCQAVSAAYWR